MNRSEPRYCPITEDIAAYIRDAVGNGSVITDAERMAPFGKDATERFRLPDLVVEARTVEQVQTLLRMANLYAFPVTPRGSGTGLAGGAVPVSGGVTLSLASMNRILSIDSANLLAIVEPGVINIDLKRAAREKNLFYPPDPASLDTCTLGGNAATNAGGPSCVKYGTTRDYVLGLEAVLPNGELVRTGVQTRKGVVGYDLTRLLVGSEGTLGIITKLFLKLIPNPPAVTTLVSLFRDLRDAMRATTAILAAGHTPCALEFLDGNCLELVGDLLPFEGVRESGAFLLAELDGNPTVISREIEEVGEICLECDAVNVLLAPDSHKRARMWEVRKEVSLRIERNSALYVPEDVAVPVGAIADFAVGLAEVERRYGMKIYSFGHAGDGNLHLNITSDSVMAAARLEKGVLELLKRTIAIGGTISGEHGIGIEKKRFLPLELSPESIRIQRGIKRLFDPNFILNPGKMFD